MTQWTFVATMPDGSRAEVDGAMRSIEFVLDALVAAGWLLDEYRAEASQTGE